MLQLDTYNQIGVPERAVKTEQVPKPEPESDPIDIWEFDRIIDTSGVGGGKDKAVLFSGGDDSLALAHYAMENGHADFVIHMDTNSSIPANIDYVRSICEQKQWPLVIISSPMSLYLFACRYGFPGPSEHTTAYQYFKGRQLAHFYQNRKGDIKLFSGVRKMESDRRMRHIDAEVQYEDLSSGNFNGWWISPLIDKPDSWLKTYRDQHDLSRNPVAEKLHRSGDCHCLAFGHRDEELTLIQSEYPEFAEWLLNVEKRVQEYRGRVYLLEARRPKVSERVQEIRKDTTPHPMRLTVLKHEFPDIYDHLVSISRETAVKRGQIEQTSYIGHGGLSSKELREKVAQADSCQKTLCETCKEPADYIATSVKGQIEQAAEDFDEKTVQTQLSELSS